MKASFFFVLCLMFMIRAHAGNIQVVTETAYPLSYLQDGKVKGAVTDVVKATLEGAALSYDIDIYPWARAYKIALGSENVLIYSMSRTPERESSFKWVGQVFPVKYYFVKLKSRQDIKINALEDARKYEIGVVIEDVRHQYLRSKGFDHLQTVNSNELNLAKLIKKRIDIFPISQLGMVSLCSNENFDCTKLEKVYELSELSQGLYMAYSKATSDEIVSKTRKSLIKLKLQGIYGTFMDEYLK